MSQGKQIEIRDNRRRQMFRIDDEYVDTYASICGANATAVYMSLCRHVNGKQESFPSIERIMAQHRFGSHNTVRKAIKMLESFGIISVKRERDPKTKRQMVNVYTLMDVASWVKPVSPNDTRAGVISEPDPVSFDAQKPVSPDDREGNTKRRLHIEGSVAQSAPASACAKEECKNKSMKGVFFCEQHQPMQCFQFVEWYRRSDQRHIKIIAEWADELFQNKISPDLRTVAQWREWAKPIMTAAKGLVVFDDDQIGAAMKRMMAAGYVTDFNLHTLKTFVINSKK